MSSYSKVKPIFDVLARSFFFFFVVGGVNRSMSEFVLEYSLALRI